LSIIDHFNVELFINPLAGSRKSVRLSVTEYMRFSRDLSQEQLIGYGILNMLIQFK